MSKSPSRAKSAKSATPKLSAKEFQKKVEELTKCVEELSKENERLKNRVRGISQKIVDNTDLSKYTYLAKDIDVDRIETNDLLHMLQTIALKAIEISRCKTQDSESDEDDLEFRINELVNLKSNTFINNKVKLKDRLDFLMQERDVWKRNAETLKKMHEKLAKEFAEKPTRPVSYNSTHTSTQSNFIEYQKPSQRLFSAAQPKSNFENLKNVNLNRLQLDQVDLNLIKQLSQVRPAVNEAKNRLVSTPKASFEFHNLNEIENNKTYFGKDSQSSLENINNSDIDSFQSYDCNAPQVNFDNRFQFSESDIQSSNIIFSRPMTSNRKNVSFNSDIHIRTFPNASYQAKKSSNNYPPAETHVSEFNEAPKSILVSRSNAENIKNIDSKELQLNAESHKENLQIELNAIDLPKSHNDSNCMQNDIQQYNKALTENLNALLLRSASEKTKNRFSDRDSVCSKRKLPGETPVKDLERTLKMVIIKELSTERVNENDWKLFAKRIGISEHEINDWISLRLQYPMARVLSVWSSNPEATVRVLHRHLLAPCFNYSILAKRIETFYDV